jgi:hypothetical protein
VALRVGIAQGTQGLLAEDHAPAEGRIRRVALEHAHVDRSLGLLQQDREIQSGRPAADDLDLHASAS